MMKNLLVPFLFAVTALVPVSSALAADLEPPPIEDLRPGYDWTGPYVGGFVGIASLDGNYDASPFCGCIASDIELSGSGYHAGLLAGWNYQFDNIVVGIEGDYAWGGEIADNDSVAELTSLHFDSIATLRARAGWAHDATLLYVTGGAAFIDTEFSGEVGVETVSDGTWLTGWTVGGGIEHAFGGGLAGRLEYLYVDVPGADYELIDSFGFGGDVAMNFEAIHMIRAGLTYNFGW